MLACHCGFGLRLRVQLPNGKGFFNKIQLSFPMSERTANGRRPGLLLCIQAQKRVHGRCYEAPIWRRKTHSYRSMLSRKHTASPRFLSGYIRSYGQRSTISTLRKVLGDFSYLSSQPSPALQMRMHSSIRYSCLWQRYIRPSGNMPSIFYDTALASLLHLPHEQ
ncbi:hypothetical protein BJX61DRAFT_232520 [Aspergillus egyptiacus]|nr:hypothetical protein BJX61DRAFT_232520 [Aspergillus egyptiacus]